MKKIKIIDLLNKIERFNEGFVEDIPKKIKYRNNIYEYCNKDSRYHKRTNEYPDKNGKDLSEVIGLMNFKYLNDEVEIIENEIESKMGNKIKDGLIGMLNHEEITYYVDGKLINTKKIEVSERQIVDKINEIIDKVNSL